MPLPLFDYQATAADLMASRYRFGLHDEMGIGKTATSIGALDRVGAKRCMVVAPAMLRENWIKEFAKFGTMERRLCKGRTIHDFIAWKRGRFDVIVTSYEQATKWTQAFLEDGEIIQGLVMDEAHYLKNHTANRTIAMLGEEASGASCIGTMAEHAFHVTGTPMSNDPMDVYTFLKFTRALDLSPEDFTEMFFTKKFGTYSTRHRVKEETLPTLRQLIYNNSIRRTHDDVGLQLPPIWLQETLIEGKTVDLQKALEAYPDIEYEIVQAIEHGDFGIMAADHIAIVRRLIGKAKAVPYAEMLKTELDAQRTKRVVFCWHVEPLLHVAKYLAKYGYNVRTVYGGTTDRDAEAAIEWFQNDPTANVILLNIKKGGTGLTLTDSYQIDMLESDWSPAGNAQALKRVHRIGQKHAVHGRFITLANSIDVIVNSTVRDKTEAIASIEGHAMTAAPLDALA